LIKLSSVIKILEAKGLEKDFNSTDHFVVAKIKGFGSHTAQTSVFRDSLNPVWNEELILFPKAISDVLLLKIYDHDTLTKDNLVGMVEVPLNMFFQNGMQDTWLQLMKRKFGLKSMMQGHYTWYCVPGQLHLQFCFGLSTQGTGIGNEQTNQQSQPLKSQGQMPAQAQPQMLSQNQSMQQQDNTGMTNSSWNNSTNSSWNNSTAQNSSLSQPPVMQTTQLSQDQFQNNQTNRGVGVQDIKEERNYSSGFYPIKSDFGWYQSFQPQNANQIRNAEVTQSTLN